MARLSDMIEEFIKELLADCAPEAVEIRRNELAAQFHCVPSQINYVIDTRFSEEKGYFVESRRGGGGCIRIYRMQFDKKDNHYFMHVIAGIGACLSQNDARIFIRNFFEYNVITEREARLLEAAVSDKMLYAVPQEERDQYRAALLKHMLTALVI